MAVSVENGTNIVELQAECCRLRNLVEQLQAERVKDRHLVELLQAERDAYLKAVYAWSRAQVSEEQLRCWASDENTSGDSLEQILAELNESNPS